MASAEVELIYSQSISRANTHHMVNYKPKRGQIHHVWFISTATFDISERQSGATVFILGRETPALYFIP